MKFSIIYNNFALQEIFFCNFAKCRNNVNRNDKVIK